jgi:hypothetical protein
MSCVPWEGPGLRVPEKVSCSTAKLRASLGVSDYSQLLSPWDNSFQPTMKTYPTRSASFEKIQQRERRDSGLEFEEYQRRNIVLRQKLDSKVVSVLQNPSPEWDDWDETRLIARQKELSTETLHTAIERGRILKKLRLKPDEYKSKNTGITFKTGYRLIQLATSPRMGRDDWTRPMFLACL